MIHVSLLGCFVYACVQDHVQGDLHKLKVELERVQQKMIKAEEAVVMALQKVKLDPLL
jgi:hypothetical protein